MEAVIFIGIPGSGKSTFYKERFFATHMRINLDMLKTRTRERRIVEACLATKQPFVVDNTNVTRLERAPFIQLSREASFRVVGYYFQSRLEDALQRNRLRSGKANIPEKGLIARHRLLEIPSPDEGFDQLYFVRIDPDTNQFIIREWE